MIHWIFLVLNLIIFLENLPWEAQFSKPAMTPPSPLSLPATLFFLLWCFSQLAWFALLFRTTFMGEREGVVGFDCCGAGICCGRSCECLWGCWGCKFFIRPMEFYKKNFLKWSQYSTAQENCIDFFVDIFGQGIIRLRKITIWGHNFRKQKLCLKLKLAKFFINKNWATNSDFSVSIYTGSSHNATNMRLGKNP